MESLLNNRYGVSFERSIKIKNILLILMLIIKTQPFYALLLKFVNV